MGRGRRSGRRRPEIVSSVAVGNSGLNQKQQGDLEKKKKRLFAVPISSVGKLNSFFICICFYIPLGDSPIL